MCTNISRALWLVSVGLLKLELELSNSLDGGYVSQQAATVLTPWMAKLLTLLTFIYVHIEEINMIYSIQTAISYHTR